MTHQLDTGRSREIAARWCALAEQRLEYLTELFETGRWRRFHSELNFLENIQEAKAAVQIWRDLSSGDPSRDNSVIDRSWIARANGTLPQGHAFAKEVKPLLPGPVGMPSEPARTTISIAPETASRRSQELLSPSETNPNSDIRLSMKPIADRYPLLRNAL
jgi:uncharacterized repeat protein (TIGR03809 family)